MEMSCVTLGVVEEEIRSLSFVGKFSTYSQTSITNPLTSNW